MAAVDRLRSRYEEQPSAPAMTQASVRPRRRREAMSFLYQSHQAQVPSSRQPRALRLGALAVNRFRL